MKLLVLIEINEEMILIDFNGMSTCLKLFYA